MKRLLTALTVALALMLALGAASAAPVLTDGNTMAWIGENSYLYLKTESGAIRRLSMTVRDLLSFSDTDLYCLMDGGAIYAIRKDGSGSSMAARNATTEQIDQLRDQRITLQEGDLKSGEMLLSNIALNAVTDGGYVYYVAKIWNGYRLMQTPLPSGLDRLSTMQTANLNGISVIEPANMTVSQEAVVITAPDGTIMTVSLETGKTTRIEAGRDLTSAAGWVDGKLYRYQAEIGDVWALEGVEAMADIGQSNEIGQNTGYTRTATATPAPRTTPRTTATPRPTATPMVTAAAKTNSLEEDGTLRRGEYGSEVRQAQRRLYNLGYPVGKIDGIYGADTQNAVNLFYDALGEKELDYMSEKMLTKLYSSRAPEYDEYMPLVKGDSGTMVRRMQQQLSNLGYSTVKLDGIYGKLTVEAVDLYQIANGIDPDPAANPGERASREMLQSLYSTGAITYADWQAQGSPIKPSTRRGWQKCGTSWLYYDGNGVRVTGWSEIEGKWFYFNNRGVMMTKWQAINGNWYYLDETQGMIKGWFEDKEAEKKNRNKGEIWFWLDENGVMATDWVEIDGTWYYFNQSGIWQPEGDGT